MFKHYIFLEDVTNIISSIPDFAASITAHSIIGLSRIVNISLGTDFVAGKNLVPIQQLEKWLLKLNVS